MLNFTNVSFAFNEKQILNNINFTLGAGEFIILLGDNGAGKSTLLRLCNGLLKPSGGEVSVCGKNTLSERSSAIAKSVGFLFQNPDRQICTRSVRDEILFGLRLIDNSSDNEKKCEDALAEFGLDGEVDPFSLSRGERQLLAIASVLVCGHSVLLLDEPTAWLDKGQTELFMNALSARRQAGTSILMITHDLELVKSSLAATMTLSDGRLCS